jgi:hypothetical protein
MVTGTVEDATQRGGELLPDRPSHDGLRSARRPGSGAQASDEAQEGVTNARRHLLEQRSHQRATDLEDRSADARDASAVARDCEAGVRDLLMAARDAGDAQFEAIPAVTGEEGAGRAVLQRYRAAESRAWAARHRACAAVDRDATAREREQAADVRADARARCAALVVEAQADLDWLTGAR